MSRILYALPAACRLGAVVVDQREIPGVNARAWNPDCPVSPQSAPGLHGGRLLAAFQLGLLGYLVLI